MAREGHEARPDDALTEVTAVLHEVGEALTARDHQGGARDRGQVVPHVGREGDDVEGGCRGRTGAAPGRPPPPFPEADTVRQAGCEDGNVLGDVPFGERDVDVGGGGREVLGHPEAVVVGSADACRAVDQDQRGHPLRVGGGQPDGRHGAPGGCQHHRAPAAGCVHHSQPVATPALDGESGSGGQRVREPEAARVEADQAAEVTDALRVAEPVRLVQRLVDGDHEPAAELEDVHRDGRARPPPWKPTWTPSCRAYSVVGASIRIAVCRAGPAGGAEHRQVSVRPAPGAPATRRSPRRARTSRSPP